MTLYKCRGCGAVYKSVVKVCPSCGSKSCIAVYNVEEDDIPNKRSPRYDFQVSKSEVRKKLKRINKIAEVQLKKMGISDYPYNPDGTSKMSKIVKEKSLKIIKDSAKGTPLENSAQLDDSMNFWGLQFGGQRIDGRKLKQMNFQPQISLKDAAPNLRDVEEGISRNLINVINAN